MMSLPTANLDGHQLRFEEGTFDDALNQGCFHLRIPEHLDLSPGIRLSREFYLPTAEPHQAYRGFRDKPSIYFDREHYQTEHILADQAAIERLLPQEVATMSAAMFGLARSTLVCVLHALGLPEGQWELGTGGCSVGQGTRWFASSHYRSERDLLGCPAHKDTGFVTVLYIEDPGLEALGLDGRWFDIDPREGHFVVNFGGALEHLTARLTTPVRAILHRVRKCMAGERDRFSFAAFINPPATGQMHQFDMMGRAHPTGSIEDFLREFNKQTWNDTHEDFGIARSG